MKAFCPLTPACFRLFLLHKSTLHASVFRLASEYKMYVPFNQMSEGTVKCSCLYLVVCYLFFGLLHVAVGTS